MTEQNLDRQNNEIKIETFSVNDGSEVKSEVITTGSNEFAGDTSFEGTNKKKHKIGLWSCGGCLVIIVILGLCILGILLWANNKGRSNTAAYTKKCHELMIKHGGNKSNVYEEFASWLKEQSIPFVTVIGASYYHNPQAGDEIKIKIKNSFLNKEEETIMGPETLKNYCD